MSRKQRCLSTADSEVRLARGARTMPCGPPTTQTCASPHSAHSLKSLKTSKSAPKQRLMAPHQQQSAHRLENPHRTIKARKKSFYMKQKKFKVGLQIPTEGDTGGVPGSDQLIKSHVITPASFTRHPTPGKERTPNSSAALRS